MIHLDESIFFWINGLAGKVSPIDTLMILLAGDIFIPILLIFSLIAIWFIGHDQIRREKNQRAVLCVLLSEGIANLVIYIINHSENAYSRLRPYETYPSQVNLLMHPSADPTFPSNMAAVCFVVAFGIWTANRKLGLFLIIPCILIGFARIYVGIHYPIDIIGGIALAVVSTGAAYLLLKHLDFLPSWFIKKMRSLYLA